MRFQKKHNLSFIFLFLLTSIYLYSQNISNSNQIINYYGLISSDLDSNMSKMTSDLYYTQLCEIQTLSVNDYREEYSNYDNSTKVEELINFSKDNINLYFKVSKIENSSKWQLTISLHNNKTSDTRTETKEYDSFYKILMEPKSTLQESLKKLIYNNSSQKDDSGDKVTTAFPEFNAKSNLSTEEFSGTWTGENYIDKIVILRGGRGFVIFNNGATMNISVKIKEINSKDSLVVTQTSRTNASFYPNLDRKLALSSANTAEPIEWSFQVIDSNTLSGTKKTLIQSNDGLTVEAGEEKVIWSRKS